MSTPSTANDSGYLARVEPFLRPVSESQDVREMLAEWDYIGDIIDHEEAIETCQLCGEQGLRYHFQVRNRLNGNTLWIGSVCIIQYHLGVYDAAKRERLDSEAAGKKIAADLREFTENKRLAGVQKAVEQLLIVMVASGLRDTLAGIWRKYDGAFSCAQMDLIAWQLAAHHIPHKPSDFTVKFRKEKSRDDFDRLRDFQRKRLLPYLTPEQLKRLA